MSKQSVVAIGVFDESGRMLLGRRVRWSNKWANPGGAVEPGESPDDAVLRELREETGLRALEVQYLGSGISGRRGELLVHAYRVLAAGEVDTSGDADGEFGDSLRWLDVSRGLPRGVVAELHVPLHKNVLMARLGLR